MKKLLGFIFSIIVAIVVFVAIIILIPMETKTAEKIELTYIFVDVDGQEYNVFDKVHGAAKDWSFLFKNTGYQNESNNDNYTLSGQNLSGDNDLGYTISIIDVSNKNTSGEIVSGNINPGDTNFVSSVSGSSISKEIIVKNTYTQNMIKNFFIRKKRFKLAKKWNTGDKLMIGIYLFRKNIHQFDKENQLALNTGQDSGENFENKDDIHNGIEQLLGDKEIAIAINDDLNLPEGAIEKPIYRNCGTPWDTELAHGDSVLAYQQRTDDPSICNVQKRTCVDGFLNGNYTQFACDEKVKYEYTKIKVIAKNEKKIDELIQNPKYAKYDSAVFGTDGKINPGTQRPKTYRNNKNNYGSIYTQNDVEQTEKEYLNCQSPRGETVQHGQFVKAYELPFGFTNSNCKVELRLCSDGDLKGTYDFGSCQYLDLTYEEYNNSIKKEIF